jgi:XTP/dITP diphosphohydrolase
MITIVTWNNWKYKQISSVLEVGGIFVKQENLDIIEPQSNNMFEVSAYKAMQAFEQIGWPVVVDDTGIFFDAYPNFPGVFSKYMYQSLWMAWLSKLFVDQSNIKAWFQCVLSYMDSLLEQPMQFVWTTSWTINFSMLDQVTIDNHLPYLSIFVPDGWETVAQMDPSYFESNHHRTKASIALREFLVSHH